MHVKTRGLCRMLSGLHSDDDWGSKALKCYWAPRPLCGSLTFGPACVAYWEHGGSLQFAEKILHTVSYVLYPHDKFKTFLKQAFN